MVTVHALPTAEKNLFLPSIPTGSTDQELIRLTFFSDPEPRRTDGSSILS